MFSLPFNKENTTMLMPKNRPVELKKIFTQLQVKPLK